MRACFMFVWLVVSATVATHSQTTNDAKTFWDKMVDAKGGRERLRSISGLVLNINGRQEGTMDRGRQVGEIHNTFVYQFPDRYWFWEDTRPSRHNAFSVTVFNALSRRLWFSAGGVDAIEQVFSDSRTISILQRDQLMYLLESRFVQPEPKSLSFIDNGRIALVEASAPGFASIKYKVDTTTYLPVECAISWWLQQAASATHVMTIEGYAVVDGLKMPSRVRGQGGELSFIINPKLDPRLFEEPPSAVTQRDAWKKYLVK
jgi:hypothetical protein